MLVRGRGRQKEEEVAASFCYRVCEASGEGGVALQVDNKPWASGSVL